MRAIWPSTIFLSLGYAEAFAALHEKVAREYPFTADKGIDWQALYDAYAPRMADARDDEEFFWAIKDFSLEIPDGHVGVGFNDLIAQIFFENYGGSFGLILAELSDGRVLVIDVLPEKPADLAGIEIRC